MKKPVSLLTLFSLIFFAASAQNNLVKNPGFEENSKPKKVGEVNKAEGWDSPTSGTADLFDKNAKSPDVGVPYNNLGLADPHSGNAYAGIILYSKRDEQREYVIGELIAPLEAGETYCIEFYVSAADLGKYAVNQIGAYFSETKIQEKTWDPLPYKSVMNNPEARILTNQQGWQVVCGEYTASGDEKYIIIGNFFAKTATTAQRMRKPRGIQGTPLEYAYYYIDDISVVNSGEFDDNCGCQDKIAKEDADGMNIVYSKVIGEQTEEGLLPEDIIETKSVFFEPTQTQLLTKSTTDLEYIKNLLIKNKDLKIEIIGFANEDEAKADPELAKKRATAVIDYLVKSGVKQERLSVGTDPLFGNAAKDDAAKAALRRCDFSVVFE